MLPSSSKYENTYSYDFERIKGIYEIARGLLFFFFNFTYSSYLLTFTFHIKHGQAKIKEKINKIMYQKKFFFSIKN